MTSDLHLKADFHSLRVLITVHEKGSISAGADSLGLSQSSVSYTIERLREVFSDPLFVRLGRGIRPTERCDWLAEEARRLIQHYEEMVVPTRFDPARATDRFTISCNFYERASLLPQLVSQLAVEAPGVTLSIVSAVGDGLAQLERNDCDLCISPVPARVSGLYSEELLSERYGCFVCPQSRWAEEGLDLQLYSGARHIMVRPAPNWRPYYLATLSRLGVEIRPHIEVSSFGEIDRIVSGTDLILTATEGFARIYAPRVVAVRAPFEAPFRVHMAWAGRTHRAPSHLWLRQRMREIAAALPDPEIRDPSAAA
ncbi:MAG: LysR family transcriptional regulator [Vannielia sp.]|uniref:LysR family transcriptional regulator n=1 Tax=Vannielia sp. TaxID=2813045 RepID=UPI003B8CED28